MKILVPDDGSAVSNRAFDKALELAKLLDYEIVLLHIIDLGSLQSNLILKNINKKSELESARLQLLSYLKVGAESMLKGKVQKAKETGIKIRFTLGMGSTPEGIVSVAKSENAAFIVMGSRGLTSEEDEPSRIRLLGSVARRVTELSDCPVMVVK